MAQRLRAVFVHSWLSSRHVRLAVTFSAISSLNRINSTLRSLDVGEYIIHGILESFSCAHNLRTKALSRLSLARAAALELRCRALLRAAPCALRLGLLVTSRDDHAVFFVASAFPESAVALLLVARSRL